MAGLPSNYLTEESEGEEDNIIQVQACAMVKDKRMKGILKDFPIPSSSTANYSHLPTLPISSMTMNGLSNQDIEDCMKYELCLQATKRGMPVDIQIPQPIQWNKYINANNRALNNWNQSWSDQQCFPMPPVYPQYPIYQAPVDNRVSMPASALDTIIRTINCQPNNPPPPRCHT